MGVYFKPLRRKVGVMTLAMACVFMMGWVRNSFIRDSVNIPRSNSSSIQLISGYQCLNLVAMWSSIPDKEMASLRVYRHDANEGIGIHVGEIMLAGSASPFRPKWPMFRFGTQNMTLMIFSIPYWSVVIPLTLISLWLLLSKPRPATQKKTTESTTEKIV